MSNVEKSKVLWCSQHLITEEQKKDLHNIVKGEPEIIPLKDFNEDLFKSLSNCPDNLNEIEELSKELIELAVENKFALFLPIGSPAFMAILMKNVGLLQVLGDCISCIFSHSERCSEEKIDTETGKCIKVCTFKHVKFIVI